MVTNPLPSSSMILLSLALACEPLPDPPVTEAVPGPARDLLLVSIDTLRTDALTRFGGTGDMPFVDGWLEGAVTLDDHLSCSNWTYTSMLCALGGRSALEMGFLPLDGDGPQDWPGEVPLLAEVLSEAGFDTALFSGSRMISSQVGTDVGYDHEVVTLHGHARDLAPEVEAWLADREGDSDRWFAHLHATDPHSPYNPPDEREPEWGGPGELAWDLSTAGGFRDARAEWQDLDDATREEVLRQLRVLYAGELRELDADLEALFDSLEELGALEDTLVVLLSDHGEQFRDHGQWTHGSSLHQEELAALLAFWHPALTPRPVSSPTTHVDLLPTVLRALDVALPADLSGVPAGLAQRDRTRTALRYDRSSFPKQLVDQEGWRLFYTWDGTVELYDLAEDPAEQRDVAAHSDEEADQLWDSLIPDVTALEALQDHTGAFL